MGSQTNKVLGRLIASHTAMIPTSFGTFSCLLMLVLVADLTAKDFEVWVSDTCWYNVHPNHGQVYDFTEWLELHHLWIRQDFRVCRKWITFSSHHDMQQWQDNHDNVLFDMERFGETIDFYNDHCQDYRLFDSTAAQQSPVLCRTDRSRSGCVW